MLKLDALELSARMRTYRTRPVAPVKPRGQIGHLTKHVGVDVWEQSTTKPESVGEPTGSMVNKTHMIDNRSRLNLKVERTKLNIEGFRAEYEAEQSSGSSDSTNHTLSHQQEVDFIPEVKQVSPLSPVDLKEGVAQDLNEDKSLFQKNIQLQPDNQSKLSKYLSKNFFKNYALYGMAIFIFMIGLVAVFRSLMVDHKIAQVVSAQESKSSNNDDQSISDVDEQKPSTDKIASYSVAPDMPKLITIEKLGIKSRIRQLNTKPDGSLDAPKNIHDSGWYTQSAKPGSPGGAAIIDGHVSGPTQKGVFYKIETLSSGDLITVELGNGTKIEYSVVKTEVEKADTLNMSKLLLPVTQGKAGLNLITCTGKFNSKTQQYEDRGVVYAQFERMY